MNHAVASACGQFLAIGGKSQALDFVVGFQKFFHQNLWIIHTVQPSNAFLGF